MELFDSDQSGTEEISQSIMYWFETFGVLVNELKRPDKNRLQKFFELWKNNEVNYEIVIEKIAHILTETLKIASEDKSRATEDLTLGEFILKHYNKLIGNKIALRAKHRPIFLIELNEIENDGIKIYQIEKKEARKKPTIETDLEFERRLIIGENIESMLSIVKPQEVGTFSILPYMTYWTDIFLDFSKFMFIITISFLHRPDLKNKLDLLINEILNSLLTEFDL
ncbi:MAG: hypothetical protein ACTSRP_08460 [Candidatus Helarchaeota archaeon]